MKRYVCLLLLVLCLGGASRVAAQKEARFMKFPDIHGNLIIFSYEGDLWRTGIDGGIAARLTSSPGNEYSPKFSPDGQWVAFTGTYDGSTNAYVMPVGGGEPKRISYMPGGMQTVCWTPDGKRVVVRSYYENYVGRDPNLYFIAREGSAPERFPIDRARLCSFSSDGSKILYQRREDEEYNRKRYKGGDYPDIWMYDFKSNLFTAITSYVGKNAYPMWIGSAMYYVSDQTNDVSNIHRMDLQSKSIVSVTTYSDVDVMMPSTDGSNIVFMHDGYVHILNVASGTVKKLAITVPSDEWSIRPRTINPKDYIHSMSAANDGKSAAFEARGDVYVVRSDRPQIPNLSETPGTREMYPQLSPDGSTVAFFSDKSGEYELYTEPAEGGPWTQLTTTLNQTNYHLLWSPDGKKILFGNRTYAIYVIDVRSKKLTKVDQSNQMKNDEFYWEISDYNWSPDSKWICYSFVQYNRNSKIFLFNTETEKLYSVTDDFYDNLNPCFDAKGDYLYYLSSRNFDVQMDFYEDNHVISAPQNVMVVQLNENDRPPFADTVGTKEPKHAAFHIDVDGLSQRTYPVPGLTGNFFYLRAGKGKILWSSVDRFTSAEYGEIFQPGGSTKWQLHIYDMNERKDNPLGDKIRDFGLSPDGTNMIIQSGSDYYLTSVEKAYSSKSFGTKLSLTSMVYAVEPHKEWLQIYNDMWRWYREFFYNEKMEGRDWKMLGERYRSYLPDIRSREDLNWVMLQLAGELATSHTYISGGDGGPSLSTSNPQFTGWLGADLIADKKSGYYRFGTIYGPTEYNANLTSPLIRPDVHVMEGEYLLEINGKQLKVPDDYFKALQVIGGQKIRITVNDKPSTSRSRTYVVEPIRNDNGLRYAKWLQSNINTVLKESKGRLGYMHINAMGDGGIGEFDKFWRAFRYKDGIIIDVRRNGGGWTEYFLIDKLERQMVSQNVLRNMVPFRYPGSTSIGNYVVLSNENNGSDGEAFIENFKARKLGTVIGVPSWGGLVGILNTQTTIDNGHVEQPNNAFYNSEGKWWIENHGSDPDIVLDNDPQSVMAGKDLELEKAIEVALQKAQEHPFPLPPVPVYPHR